MLCQFSSLEPAVSYVVSVRNNRYAFLAITFTLIALSSIGMAALYSLDPEGDPLRIYYGTDTRAAGFLVGAALAIVRSARRDSGARVRATAEFSGWSGLLALMILYNQLNEFQAFLYRGGILLTALASALLIVGASSPGTTLGRLLETPVFRWIGSRSYSIYLWHWPVFMLTRPGFDVDLPGLPVRIGQVMITFAIAELSYRWIETPVRQKGFRASFRSLQSVFSRWSVPQRVVVGAGIMWASLLLIWQGSIHQVTANTIPQETPFSPTPQSVSSVHVTAIPATKPRPTSTPHATTPSIKLFPSVTATPTVNLPRVTLIGDSIMQGAAPMMDDVLGEDIYIDAARKRKMEDVPALVVTLSREGHLARVVVIHLGSNRPFEPPVFDQVMETLLAHGVERVMFVNVHRPIRWEDYINQKLAQGVARWPEAELIDWEAMAHYEQGWFIEDQTHLSYAGSKAYVGAIKASSESTPKNPDLRD